MVTLCGGDTTRWLGPAVGGSSGVKGKWGCAVTSLVAG